MAGVETVRLGLQLAAGTAVATCTLVLRADYVVNVPGSGRTLPIHVAAAAAGG